MKTASELRKGLDEALKPDTSGKTTPIQRLTPFLRELVAFLEQEFPEKAFFADPVTGEIISLPVSSDAATQAVPASPTNEPGSASKATA